MRVLVAVVFCLMGVAAKAQDPAISQPYGAPLYLNPSFAGYEGCSHVALSYRNQWPGLSGNYQTVLASYDQYVHPMRGGIGVNFTYHYKGEMNQSWAASAIYSPVFRLFDKKLALSPAVELGWRANEVYQILSPYSGCFGYFNGDTIYHLGHDFDMSVGFILSHHGLTYGLAISHLTEPNRTSEGIAGLPRKYTGHLAYTVKVHDRVRIMASTLYINQLDYQMIYPTFMISAFGARLGGGYRLAFNNIDHASVQAGYTRKWVSVGYSYDFTVSSLSITSGGAHEVNLQFRFNCKNKERGVKGDSLWGF